MELNQSQVVSQAVHLINEFEGSSFCNACSKSKNQFNGSFAWNQVSEIICIMQSVLTLLILLMKTLDQL